MYRTWQAHLPSYIEVCAVQLPGHETRIAEPALTSIDTVAEQATQAIEPLIEEMPCALFGHSMGALVAYEVASRLASSGAPPIILFASGCRAPQLPIPQRGVHLLSDDDFVARLSSFARIPSEVFADPWLMALLVPVLRADFGAFENYRYRPRVPMACRVAALGGADDEHVSATDLMEWRQQTSQEFDVRCFAGGHFYLTGAQPALLSTIAAAIERALAEHNRGADSSVAAPAMSL